MRIDIRIIVCGSSWQRNNQRSRKCDPSDEMFKDNIMPHLWITADLAFRCLPSSGIQFQVFRRDAMIGLADFVYSGLIPEEFQTGEATSLPH